MKTPAAFSRFPERHLAVLRRLDTPRKIQDFLDYDIDYNDEEPLTCFSPLQVLERGKAHCIEGAMLAAAAFMFHGRRPLLLDLRANSRDDDHVIAPFTFKGRWGAVGQSHFCGLRYREPVYPSFSELARSYFEFYYNSSGEKTLRAFSVPMSVSALRPEWLYSARNVFFVGRKLDEVRHFSITGHLSGSGLRRADSLLAEAEVIGGASRLPLIKRRPKPYSALKLGNKRGKAI